jgi:DNA-binding protein HU-beta
MAEKKKLTQAQIITGLAEKVDLNKKVVKGLFEELEAMAVRETKRTGVFIVPGIGRLVRSDRKARMGRNPATGQPIKIPAKKVVKFRVAKSAKDAIVPPKK